MRGKGRGFSLIELLIVVAIILIIAAIAVPKLMRARIAANQMSAIASMRVINTAKVTYILSYGAGFSSTLAQLGPPTSGSASVAAAGLLDSVLASGLKGSYSFSYTAGTPDAAGNFQAYQVNGNPTSQGVSGTTYYYTDQSAVIRGNTTGPAGSADSAVAN